MSEQRQFKIWSEGYRATGESGTAYYHGTKTATSLKEACKQLAMENKEFARYWNPDSMTYWGCRLFDNEADARKSFG